MAENKKSFLLYTDVHHTVKKLSDIQAGQLFKHILSYVNDENPQTTDVIIDLVFEPIKQSLKRDLRKYEEIREKRSFAGKISADKRQQVSTSVESDEQIEQVSTHSTVSVNVNDIVSDNEIVIVKEEKNALPSFEEFKSYALENNSSLSVTILELKYKAWIQNGWKDGNNKKIVNWKSKLLNTIPYLIKNENSSGNSKRSVKRINDEWNN